MAYAIHCMNNISDKGIALLSSDYKLTDDLSQADGILVRSASLHDVEFPEGLRAIARAGAGVNNIPLDRCAEAGIVVFNTPGANANAVKELVIAGLMMGARDIAGGIQWCRDNADDPNIGKAAEKAKKAFAGTEIMGKKLGVIGLGAIGALVANAAVDLGMDVYGYDPFVSVDAAWRVSSAVHHVTNLDNIYATCDYLTIHVPSLPDTIGMIGARAIAQMKGDVVVLNFSRDTLVDEAAMAAGLESGKVRRYITDFATPAVMKMQGAVVLPHLGASTKEAQQRAGVQTAEFVAAGLEGSIVPTAINLTPLPPEVMSAVGPYVPACELMGSMLAQIDHEVPKSLKVDLQGGLISSDPSMLVAGTLKGLLTYHSTTTVTPVNAAAVAKRHGIKVETTGSREAGGYSTAVSVTADGSEIACTMVDATEKPRLISLFGYKMDIAPGARSLIFEYIDAPGRVGTIGTILGEEGINITTMQIGTKPEEQCALVYMNVEGDVTDEVLDKLREALPDLKNLWSVKL